MEPSDSQARPPEALDLPPVEAWGPDPDEVRDLLQARGQPVTLAAVRDVARKARVPERYVARVAAFYGLQEPPESPSNALRVRPERARCAAFRWQSNVADAEKECLRVLNKIEHER